MRHKRAGRPPVKNHSTLLYLRQAKGLSQRTLGAKVGLRSTDISKFEHGRRGISLSKIIPLAQYFGVSCSTLLNNDFKAVFASMNKPIEINEAARARNIERQLGRSKSGFEAEDWVYLQEQEKLKDTEYCYAVNPNYSVNERSHFDILSFTPDGDFIYIEVKGSKGGLEEPFFMSTAELAFLEECMIQGLNYELHRVIYAKDPEKRKRIIYTPKEVLENYIYEPSNYLFRLKEEVL